MIKIMFDGFSQRKINYAIDYANDKCYLGLWIPCKTTLIDKKTKKSEITEKEELCFVGTGGDLFVATQEELEKRGLRIDSNVERFGSLRWDMNHLKKHLFLDIKDLDHRKTKIEKELGATKYQQMFEDAFEQIREIIKKYIELPEKEWYDIISCWIIGTYFYKLFSSYGYLFLHGTKRAGKSKLGSLIELIAFNGVKSGVISGSGLFKVIDYNSSTIIYDESENLAKSNDRQGDIVAVLNDGYKVGGRVLKNVPYGRSGWTLKSWNTYSPKVICNVYGIGFDTLLDRCIMVTMIRGINPKIINTEIEEHDKTFQNIRNKLYLLTLEYWKAIDLQKNLINIDGISGRNMEVWKPVLTIAKVLENVVNYDGIVKFVKKQLKVKEQLEQTEEVEHIILKILENYVGEEWIPVKTITNIASEQLEKIGEKGVGRVLTRLGFKNKRRVGSGIQYLIKYSEYYDICQRLKVDIDYDLLKKKLCLIKETTQTTLQVSGTTLNDTKTTPETTLNDTKTTLN